VERPDLAAVGVPGDLQRDARLGGLHEKFRLVGEQHDRQRRVRPGQRGGRSARVPAAGRHRSGRRSGDHQLVAAPAQHLVAVVQRLPADPGMWSSQACASPKYSWLR